MKFLEKTFLHNQEMQGTPQNSRLLSRVFSKLLAQLRENNERDTFSPLRVPVESTQSPSNQ